MNQIAPLPIVRWRILLHGCVQGVGFRPFAYRLASEHHLVGWVQNSIDGAIVEVQGPELDLQRFMTRLARGPEGSRVESVQSLVLPNGDEPDFRMIKSTTEQSGSITPPADRGPCSQCLVECSNPSDRRYRYPLINCVTCGPRYTLLKSMPFDREQTSMADFPLCSRCQREYTDPDNRRFHAQTMSCPDCGPQLEWVTREGRETDCATAIDCAQQTLHAGGIIAVKGVGGFHFACDAFNSQVVARLRQVKGRESKPFAMLMSSIEQIRRYAHCDIDEAQWLESPARPIVLLQRRESSDGPALAVDVAKNVMTYGFMLPSSPLHGLLLTERPLVMTSGNLSGDPLIKDNEVAIARLLPLADGILMHQRKIQIRCDDSVLQKTSGGSQFIRRSRGYVPEPLVLPGTGPCVLALGGEFKNAPALAINNHLYMGPHVGDLQGWESLIALEEAVTHLCRILNGSPEAVTCDSHSGYLSQRWAREYAEKHGLPLIKTFHHEAHAASWQVDTQTFNSDALVAVFDGTGAGPDGTIWGGEFFHRDARGATRRVAYLKPVPMPGVDHAVHHPARMALAHLWATGLSWDSRLPCVTHFSPIQRNQFRQQLDQAVNTPLTSSVGRLFDAIAAMLGVCQVASYEGQAAIELEAIADTGVNVAYEFEITPAASCLIIDPAPVLAELVRGFLAGLPIRTIAGRFHTAVARMITEVFRELHRQMGISVIGVSGGVFQNRLLLSQLLPSLQMAGLHVRTHSRLPCNDGGLAAGQALLARQQLLATE